MVPVFVPDGWPSPDFQRLPADARGGHGFGGNGTHGPQFLGDRATATTPVPRRHRTNAAAAANSRRKTKSPVFAYRTKPGCKVRSPPTPAFRDLWFKRVRAWRAPCC